MWRTRSRSAYSGGSGNNGGDAFETARLLRQRFFDTQVVFVGAPDRLPKDAEAAYRRFIAAGGRTLDTIPLLPHWSLIIDGLFGIGSQRAITGGYAELVRAANHLAARDRCPLLALDCPSGLDADTVARPHRPANSMPAQRSLPATPSASLPENPVYTRPTARITAEPSRSPGLDWRCLRCSRHRALR